MKVSIIMPVWIRNKKLEDLSISAINSLLEPKAEFIIIDNGSPELFEYGRSVSSIFIRNRENLGYAKAVNQGFRLASGDLIAVANNDIRVTLNWLEAAEAFAAQPIFKVGSLHYRMIGYGEKTVAGDQVWLSGKERWCSSSFFVIRRDAIPEGGFDENYGLGGGEDWDFWLRVRRAGWNTAYTNMAYYEHKDSSTLKTLPTREKDGKRASTYFREKWGASPEELFEKDFPGQLAQAWKPMP